MKRLQKVSEKTGRLKKKPHHFLQCQQELYGKEESLKSLGNLSLPLCGQDFTQINENLIEEEKKGFYTLFDGSSIACTDYPSTIKQY